MYYHTFIQKAILLKKIYKEFNRLKVIRAESKRLTNPLSGYIISYGTGL